jgi:hypothetical protein
MIHRGHEHFSDRRGDRYAPVVFRVGCVSFPFVEGDDLGCAPRLGWGRRDSTGV